MLAANRRRLARIRLFEALDRDHFYDSIDQALTTIDDAGSGASET